MPLTINVGLSRKTSENYNSTGTSINLTAELDQSLLTRPDELQDAIAELYEQAEDALEQQAQTDDEPRKADPRDSRRGSPRSHARNGNGRQGGNGQNGGSMTDSQKRAIHAIAGRLDVDPAEECRHELGLDLDSLSIREASKLIDHLKALQPAERGSRNGGGR